MASFYKQSKLNVSRHSVVCRKSEKKMQADRRISCRDLGGGDCEGRLWLKKTSLLKNKFVRRWCVLKNSCMFFYMHSEDERAEGLIYVKDFRVAPVEDFKAHNFFFKIFNKLVTFTFACESPSSFSKWLNKLQISASGIDVGPSDGPMAGFNNNYIRSESSTLRSTGSTLCQEAISESGTDSNDDIKANFSESEESDDNDDYEQTERLDTLSDIICFDMAAIKLKRSKSDSTTKSPYFPLTTLPDTEVKVRPSVTRSQMNVRKLNSKLRLSFAEKVDSISVDKRTTEELNEMTMNAIKRIVDIERLLRDKTKLLEIVDQFLKKPTSSDSIQQFWDEYGDFILKPFPAH